VGAMLYKPALIPYVSEPVLYFHAAMM